MDTQTAEGALPTPITAPEEGLKPEAPQQTASPANAESNHTEIGPSIIIRGKLKSGEDLIVRGRIEAEISSSKSLHVGESGIIKANVNVSSARIDGILVGNVEAEDRLEIAAEGRVVGDLHAPRIVIREGAAFRGNIDMPGFDDESKQAVTKPNPKASAEQSAATTEDASEVSTASLAEATSAAESASIEGQTAPGQGANAGHKDAHSRGVLGRKRKRQKN